jgi:trehalose 6-phosphate phosphatase
MLKTVPQPPSPQPDWALFLDLDGTLLDIAPRPDAVIVPDGLLEHLSCARAFLGGALAIVSGRKVSDIERFLAPLDLPLAGEHGAVLRIGGAEMMTARMLPPSWIIRIRQKSEYWPGVLVEEKRCGLTVHYRQVPEYARAIERFLAQLVDEDRSFEVLPAHMAFELRDGFVHKGRAVAEFMKRTPFAGRIPIFVGDDITDEDGIREAEARGGLGLRVKDTFSNSPACVRAWLEQFRV